MDYYPLWQLAAMMSRFMEFVESPFGRRTYLHPRLGEVNLHGNFLAGVDVRIVRLLEGTFQFLELGRREGGSYPALFPLLRQHRIVTGVHFVGKAGCKGKGARVRRI